MGAKAKHFTAKQLKAIELLASRPDMTNDEMCAELKCSETTLCKWKRDPAFISEVVSRAREILRESLPSVYKVLGEKSKTGNPAHLKLLLEHQEKLEEMKARTAEGMISFTWRLPERDEEEVVPTLTQEEDEEEV